MAHKVNDENLDLIAKKTNSPREAEDLNLANKITSTSAKFD